MKSKKLFFIMSLFIAVVLALSVNSICYADDMPTDVDTPDELKTALLDSTIEVVRLTADIELNAENTPSNYTINVLEENHRKLDLNGYTLTQKDGVEANIYYKDNHKIFEIQDYKEYAENEPKTGTVITYGAFAAIYNSVVENEERQHFDNNSFIFNHITYKCYATQGAKSVVIYKAETNSDDRNVHFTIDGITFYYLKSAPLDEHADIELLDYMEVLPLEGQTDAIGFYNDTEPGITLRELLGNGYIIELNGEVFNNLDENARRINFLADSDQNRGIRITENKYTVNYVLLDEYGNELELDPEFQPGPDRVNAGGFVMPRYVWLPLHSVEAWYKDEDFNEIWEFETDIVNDNITLYGKCVERTEYDVWVGGHRFTASETTKNLANGQAIFDPLTNTIYLQNVTIDNCRYWTVNIYDSETNELVEEINLGAAIYSELPNTRIVLEGTNIISLTTTSDEYDVYGILASEGCNILIEGEDTDNDGIGDLGTLEINDCYCGIRAGNAGEPGGSLEINNGAIVTIHDIKGAGVWVNNDLRINGTSLVVNKTSEDPNIIEPGIKINEHGTLLIAGGTLTVTNPTEAIMFCDEETRFFLQSGSVTLTTIKTGNTVIYYNTPDRADFSMNEGRLEINVPKNGVATNITDQNLHLTNTSEGFDRNDFWTVPNTNFQIVLEVGNVNPPTPITEFNVTDDEFGAIPDDNLDDSVAINNTLAKARTTTDTITVYVPKGQYILDEGLCIYSDTKFILDKEAVLKFRDGVETYALLTGYSKDWENVGGYNRIQNIEIDGGGDGTSVGGAVFDRNSAANELSCVLFLPHGNNIKIHGITVQNCTEHMINVSADKNVQIYDTMLKNQIAYTGDSATYWEGFENNATGRALRYFHAEAIHTDFTNPGNNECEPLDNTHCENIMIDHCYFENVLSGIGQHQEREKIGDLKVKNVTVKNCQFKDVLYGPAVNAYSFDNLVMDSNIISYTGNPDHSGIGIFAKESTGKITNNTITSKGDYEDHGIIHLDSSNFEVYNKNDIDTTSTYAIKVEGGQASVKDTVIRNVLRDGIRVNNTSSLTLYKNTISNITRYGIFVQGNRGNTNIELNKIRTSSSQLDNTAGILLENAPDNNIIKGNDITGDLKHDIQINTSNVSIIDNVLDTCKDNVLQLYNSNVTVQGNTIKNSAYHGIYVNGGPDSGKATIKSNVINNIAQTGIRAENIPLGVISGNKVSNVNVYGIYVSDTNQSITISENNVYGQGSAEKDWSASIYTKNCSSALIENNIATFGKESGIYIENSQGTIRGNKSVVNEGNGLKTKGTESNNTTFTINNNELGTKSQNKDKYALILDQYSKNCSLSCNALVSKGFYAIKDGTVSYNKNTTFTGLAMAGGTWYYFENGDLSNKTTLAQYNGSWFCVRNGQIDWNYTGLVEYSGNWFYVQKGQVDWKANNMLVDYEGRWYYIKGGIVDWSYTGLCQYNGRWYYIKGGMINWTEETLVSYNNIWFKVKGGLVDWNYTGLCQYNGRWYYIKGGMINWNYTGLCQYNGTWFYVKGGMINWTEETLVSYNNIWFKVKGGLVDWNYIGLFNYKGTLFYIKGGTINWNYNGTATYNGKQYNVKGGIAQ